MTAPNGELAALVSGMLVTGYAVAGTFFLRFWRKSHDRLFALFAGAFWILAMQRLLLTLVAWPQDAVWLYALRVLAFTLILVAILDKNRPGSS
ncbi:MAG TPA: DUF5985 family protein [Candidatus Elarobacter sp.]|nr:DUF5985 family protein [Candidatus Elarobacter sp.]